MSERLRLTEILTTSSAVANYLGVPEVSVSHVRQALSLLKGETTLDDLGRPQSPLLARVTGAGKGAEPALRALAQRWFARLGGDAAAEFDEAQLAEFEAELTALEAGE